MSLPERPDTFRFRVGSASGGSYIIGSIMGAVSANWADTPMGLRDKPWVALARTGQIMNNYGITFAAVGAVYALTDYAAENIRGKKDYKNGALGGLAAGVAMGLRKNYNWRATSGLSMLFALCSMAGEISTVQVTNGYFDDGLTPLPKVMATRPRPAAPATDV